MYITTPNTKTKALNLNLGKLNMDKLQVLASSTPTSKVQGSAAAVAIGRWIFRDNQKLPIFLGISLGPIKDKVDIDINTDVDVRLYFNIGTF
jgi:hypothetical protein